MKLGIVGSGMIVRLFSQAMKYLDNVKPVAMWTMTQDLKNAEPLAENLGISRLYDDYSLFLQDEQIEVVYVGVINSAHYSFALEALQAGKPVILEKPFTSNLDQAQKLIDLAKEKKLMLIEGVSFLHSPIYRQFAECVSQLDNIRLAECRYVQYSSRYDSYLEGRVLPAFDPQLCGGALYDINIYNINLIVSLFGKPQKVYYHANIGYNGIDTSGTAVLDYEGFKAVCIGGKDASNTSESIISGRNGIVRLHGAPNTFASFSAVINGEENTWKEEKYDSHMVYEFLEFERIYRENDWPSVEKYLQQSENVMWTADQLRKSAGIVFPCDQQ